MLCQALFIIAKQSVNSNWSYKPETANLGQNQWFFLPHVNLKFHGQPWKTIRHLFYVASSFVHHFIPISEFKLGLQSRNTQFGSKSMIFFFFFFVQCDLEIWQITMTGRLWKKWSQTTRQTDRSVLRATWLQLKTRSVYLIQCKIEKTGSSNIFTLWQWIFHTQASVLEQVI